MPVSFTLQPVPDLTDRVCEPGDISFGEGKTYDVTRNYNGRLYDFRLALIQITFSVKGLSGAEVTQLSTRAETNLTNMIKRINPSFRTIAISGKTYQNCFLRSAKPSGSYNIESDSVVENTELIYETQDFELV
jgi:hypothetical protein